MERGSSRSRVLDPSVVILGILTLMVQSPAPIRAAGDADLARTRFVRLSRGINVDWLSQKGFKLDRALAEREARTIKAAGCRNIRLVMNVDGLRDPERRAKPDAGKLAELDAAIAIALEHDLAVIVDPFHYGADGLLKFPGPGDPEAEVLVGFWAALAAHLSRSDPERVFFEVANEPGLEDPQDWYALEIRILRAMRENAPRHTLIAGYNQRVSKNEWDPIKALTLFPELADKNVVFNFHYYHPMTFTHQGAPWTKNVDARLSGVPYPADREALDRLIAETDDPEVRWALKRYRDEGWDRRKIEAELAVAARWAEQRGVLVTCNEFGVYRKAASPAARAAWTRDVRESLERLGIGWDIWGGDFGFLPHERASQRQEGGGGVDGDIIEALGLRMPPAGLGRQSR